MDAAALSDVDLLLIDKSCELEVEDCAAASLARRSARMRLRIFMVTAGV